MSDTSNTADVIDMRDAIARFEELETELQDRHETGGFMSDFQDWISNSRDNSNPVHAAFPDDGAQVQSDIEEFYKLQKFIGACKGYGGDEQWRGHWYPVVMVRDSYFRDFAEEEAESIGAINGNAKWPNNCIDWDRAARELRMDYSAVDYDGVTYWYR